ncbi:MAG: response regulator [Chitinophagaceae bacterium]|nr:MAG: response regulator [Chitinophagaceae bacterium]
MKKVMIIEDDEAINDILTIILKNGGYSVTSAHTGSLVSYTDSEMPDLFVIDKNLPGVDGVTICREIKSNPATQHIPVVMISANHSFIRPASTAGADACIPKPFSRQELLTTIEHLVGDKDF